MVRSDHGIFLPASSSNEIARALCGGGMVSEKRSTGAYFFARVLGREPTTVSPFPFSSSFFLSFFLSFFFFFFFFFCLSVLFIDGLCHRRSIKEKVNIGKDRQEAQLYCQYQEDKKGKRTDFDPEASQHKRFFSSIILLLSHDELQIPFLFFLFLFLFLFS